MSKNRLDSWLVDTRISMCSPLARGVWMDWLLALHEMAARRIEPKLTGTIHQLARVSRSSPDEAMRALSELWETSAASVFCEDYPDFLGCCSDDSVIEVADWDLSQEFKERHGATLRKRRQRERGGELNAIKENARTVVARALASGALCIGDCESCGLEPLVVDGRQRIEAHHEDYSHPLDVQWLCTGCHAQVHSLAGGAS